MFSATNNNRYYQERKNFFWKCLGERTLGEDDHQYDQGNQEHNREGDGDSVQVLFHQTGARIGVVQGAGNDIGDTGALTGMEHDERNQTDAGCNQQDKEDNNQSRQFNLFLTCKKIELAD